MSQNREYKDNNDFPSPIFMPVTDTAPYPQYSQYSTLPNKKSNFESSESIEGKSANVEKHKAQQKFPHEEVLRKHSTQNSQYSQYSTLNNNKSSYESYESFEGNKINPQPTPIYELVGDYPSEQALFADLIKYPQCVPCPKNDWAWQIKDRCYQKCRRIPKECIYYSVAFYRVQS